MNQYKSLNNFESPEIAIALGMNEYLKHMAYENATTNEKIKDYYDSRNNHSEIKYPFQWFDGYLVGAIINRNEFNNRQEEFVSVIQNELTMKMDIINEHRVNPVYSRVYDDLYELYTQLQAHDEDTHFSDLLVSDKIKTVRDIMIDFNHYAELYCYPYKALLGKGREYYSELFDIIESANKWVYMSRRLGNINNECTPDYSVVDKIIELTNDARLDSTIIEPVRVVIFVNECEIAIEQIERFLLEMPDDTELES